MNKFTSLFAITLLLANTFVWAEADRSRDLRYCLDLPTDQLIAKCAGEVSPDKQGKPFSKEEVERMLSRENASTPTGTSDLSGIPASAGDKAGKDFLPGTTESNSN